MGGVSGTAATFDQIGFTPGKANAIAAGLGEAGGGALLALVSATPTAGAAVAGTMGVAASMHAPKGFFANAGGLPNLIGRPRPANERRSEFDPGLARLSQSTIGD